MKKVYLLVSLLLAASAASGEQTWFRQSSISPDGSTIVLSYKGDIYTVPASGGRATRLTSSSAYDGYPVWSPDGELIAFSSDRCGSLDVFVMPGEGGTPKRLTTNSLNETTLAFVDEDHVLYASSGMPPVDFIGFPGRFTQVYSVDTAAHRPTLFSAIEMDQPSVRGDQILYHDKKGYENTWRKHHRSPITRDVYLTQVEPEGRTFRCLTSTDAENQNPVWTSDGKGYCYLSEDDGTMNVYYCATFDSAPVRLTSYTKHPVRYLSSSTEGTLCYSWDGGLYTLRRGEKPKKVEIEILTDEDEAYHKPVKKTTGAKQIALGKDAKEVAFTLSGDIYVTSTDYKTTRRLTSTTEYESQPSFSPDGKTLAYASDRSGRWQIYVQKIDSGDTSFTYAPTPEEELLLSGSEDYTSPKFSPDGKKLAYITDRCEIRVYDFDTQTWTVALPAEHHFSYTDGDMQYSWSPDGKWLLSTSMANGGYFHPDVVVFSPDGKEIHNLTESGYSDAMPQWALGGKAVVWLSDRAGYRSHGSWGAERDAYILYLDKNAYRLSKLGKEAREVYSVHNRKSGGVVEDTAKTSVDLDFDRCEDRIVRLTATSSNIEMCYLAPDGLKFYYVTQSEGQHNLWVRDLEDKSTKILVQKMKGGTFVPDEKGENLYLCTDGAIKKLTLSDGKLTNIDFEAETEQDDAAWRSYVFHHSVAQLMSRFCDEQMHGVDFAAYAAHYEKFLPSIGTERDLAEMVSELLGELNCSHTGMGCHSPNKAATVGDLGAFYDESYRGDGLKIKEVLADGPLDLASERITAGCVITKIDGKPVLKDEDYYPLLAGKAGVWTLLTITDAEGDEFTAYVYPVSFSTLTPLLYDRWVDRCEETTRAYSGGRIGYVHIESMDSKSFRHVYSEILGKLRDCDALVVDERHNGGGWLHDDLALLFSGKQYYTFTARGREIGIEPFTRWIKPSCVLICEDCYSNASGFPVAYRAFGDGKLVGAPMAGTMTAVWWEYPGGGYLSLGIPLLSILNEDGEYLENLRLDPDIEVYNTPEQMLSGDDRQLKRAIDLMLEETAGNR